MSKRKKHTLKFTFLEKGETVDYQTMVEERIGDELARLDCYTDEDEDGNLLDRACFIADQEYDIIIQPKKTRKHDGRRNKETRAADQEEQKCYPTRPETK